jgi:REP element-mobilizing transposase RayT
MANRRRSIRLKGYDYSLPGMYFVTICTAGREILFGDVRNGQVQNNDAGCIVQTVWDELPDHYPGLEIDAFVVMPNHVHGILILYPMVGAGLVRAGLKPAPTDGNPGVAGAGLVRAGLKPAPTDGNPGVAGAGLVRAGFVRAGFVRAGFVRAGLKPAPTELHPVTEIVRGFKTFSARRINDLRQMRVPVWQRNYYEHIIRNGQSLQRIRQYIGENPARWQFDRENPKRTG